MLNISRNFVLVALMTIAFALSGCGDNDTANKDTTMTDNTTKASTVSTADFRSVAFNTISGEKTNMQAFDGKVVVAVNVASKCGFTKQYAGLEELYRKYQDQGLVVVGFPANNFGGQEPGTNEEILTFCQSNFDVTFPMMAKVSVKGDDKHPLFKYLTEESDIPGEIQWNFSKFILDRQGKLVARFPSQTEPTSGEMIQTVEELL